MLGSELRSSHFRVLNSTTFSAATQEILLNFFLAPEMRASLKVLTNKLEGNQLLHCSSRWPPHRLLITCCWARAGLHLNAVEWEEIQGGQGVKRCNNRVALAISNSFLISFSFPGDEHVSLKKFSCIQVCFFVPV